MKWSIDEEKDLINLTQKCKEHNLTLNDVFEGHSAKYSRTKNAVKKHYYSLMPKGDKDSLKNAILDIEKRQKVVNIDSFKKPVITEKDLEALFKGLVKLIKESCERD